MKNTIECTFILTDKQLRRLQSVTQTLKNSSKNEHFTEQMALQLAVGTPHLVEIILIMLENYVVNNIKEKHP